MTKEDEILNFLSENVFQPILNSKTTSQYQELILLLPVLSSAMQQECGNISGQLSLALREARNLRSG